nr:hypothetical protein [Ferrimicrobium acidiphilum]
MAKNHMYAEMRSKVVQVRMTTSTANQWALTYLSRVGDLGCP